jgi:hypothetical protein
MSRRWYFLPSRQWGLIAAASTGGAVATAGAYMADSLWLGLAVAVTIGLLLHTFAVSRTVPWIPGLAALVAMVQWVLAPWAAYHVPPIVPTFYMPLPPHAYFGYAVPATLVWVLGLYLPLRRPGRSTSDAPRAPIVVPKSFRLTCDLMVAVGLAASALLAHGTPAAIDYAVRLVSDLSFVGALGLLIARVPGWGWRLGAVLAARAAMSSADGMFHDVVIWAVYSCAVGAFVFRVRPAILIALAAGALVMMGALNEIKTEYRAELSANPDLPLGSRVELLGTTLATQLQNPTSVFTELARSRAIARLNQGWIIARTLVWVPANEPFANGETVENAVWSAIIPRVARQKYEAGGVYFQRFTGMPLPRATSMNLSIAGEMYANYGPAWGLFGVGAVAVLVGLIFRGFALRGRRSPLWYAWAPYVLLYAVQAENGLGEEINQITKSLIVTALLVTVLPAWNELRGRPRAPVAPIAHPLPAPGLAALPGARGGA